MSIRLRIFIGLLLVVGVGVAFFLDWIIDDLTPQYRQSTEEPVVDTASILASLAAATATHGYIDTALFRSAFHDVYQRSFTAPIYQFVKTHVDLHVYMTDAQGQVIFDSIVDAATGAGRDEGKDYATWRDVYLTLRGQYGARTTRQNPDDPLSSVMYVAAPIMVHNDIIGVVSVGKPTRNVNQFVASARRKILFAGFATGVAMLLVGLVMSGTVTRPLRRLTDYAQAVRDGQRITLPPLGRSEIGTLGQAFEEMRDALEGKQYVEHYVQALTHEIKSPLAAIQGAAELLQEDMPAVRRKQFLHNIGSEAQRIQAVIDKLLLLSSLETRKAIEDVDIINVYTLLQDVQRGLMPLVTARGQQLELYGSTTAEICGDAFLVRQAAANLLINAIEFTQPGGTITATVQENDHSVSLSVQDNGPGIPDYALQRVFERFYSLPRPSTGKKSSGLGLSLVYEVATLHGGDITLANAHEGGGVARLTLPHMPPSQEWSQPRRP